ncbi:hypothetical protein D9M70_492360 [compost metagenome]
MGDVGKEHVAGAQRADSGRTDRCGRIAFHQHIVRRVRQAIRAEVDHQLGEAIRAGDELAVRVDGDQRHIEGVEVIELDAQQVTCLRLDHAPSGHTAEFHVIGGAEQAIGAQVAVGDQPAGCNRNAANELIGPQEDLVRGMRGVGLVLVDEGRGLVVLRVHVVGGTENAVHTRQDLGVDSAGDHHELQRRVGQLVACSGDAVRTVGDKRIVRLQRNEDRAVLTLLHQVEAVVEELPEERHPGIERCR